MKQKCGPHMEHPSSSKLPSSLKSYDLGRRRDRELGEEKSLGISGQPDDDEGFASLAQLESA